MHVLTFNILWEQHSGNRVVYFNIMLRLIRVANL
jgi:hypothetical protein